MAAWLAVNKDGSEYIYNDKPYRRNGRWNCFFGDYCIELPKGSVKRIIGMELTWLDEPVEIE